MYRILSSLLRILVITVFAGATAANGVSAQSRATARDQTRNLTGAWTLNKNLSEDPAKAMEATQGGDHAGSGGGHARPGSSGGHGAGAHGGSAAGGSRGGMNPQLLEAPGRLTITQTGSSITFTDGNGRSQTLTTDNKKQKLPLNNRTVDVKTKWDEGRLVKDADLGDGMKLTETYSLVPQPRQLHVMVKLEGSHLARPVNFRRVYDAESLR